MKTLSKKIYILPGWGHLLSDEGYKKLLEITSVRGYTLQPLDFNTRNPERSLGGDELFSDLIKRLSTQIPDPCDEDIILGFSIGALIAYKLSGKRRFSQAIICSMSPCLGNDLRILPREETVDFSEAQYQEMVQMEYGKSISTKITFLYGSKETTDLKERSIDLGKQNHSTSIEISNADHELDDIYVEKIKEVL